LNWSESSSTLYLKI